MNYDITIRNHIKYSIGIAVLMILLSCGNENVDCNVKGTFTFTNETDYKLETGKGIIDPNGLLTVTQEDIGTCDITESEYISPLFDSPTIIVNDSFCKTYISTSASIGDGPLGIANFTSKKVDNNNYEFYYTFTTSEFENLKKCN